MRDLAEKAGVHRNTVYRAEGGRLSDGPAAEWIVQALEAAGVVFGRKTVSLKKGAIEMTKSPISYRQPQPLSQLHVHCCPLGQLPEKLVLPQET